jgi:hypothetical protein
LRGGDAIVGADDSFSVWFANGEAQRFAQVLFNSAAFHGRAPASHLIHVKIFSLAP